MRALLAALLLLIATPAWAAASFDRPPAQGGLSVGHAAPGSRVSLDGRALRVSPEGVFVIGFGRDDTAARLEITPPGGKTEIQNLKLVRRKFDIQRIDGLPERQVDIPPDDLKRLNDDNAQVAAVRVRDTPETWFLPGFIWPATGPISGVYGSQRILNGKPRAAHWGVDIAVPVGTPIVAAAEGIVTLAHEDMLLNGKTMLIDHGYGVNTTYLHMSRMVVAVGQHVKQGEVIGYSGQTGRATGPHLHWALNVFGVRLDPALVVPPMPKQNAAK